jgi:hypothetical protein
MIDQAPIGITAVRTKSRPDAPAVAERVPFEGLKYARVPLIDFAKPGGFTGAQLG